MAPPTPPNRQSLSLLPRPAQPSPVPSPVMRLATHDGVLLGVLRWRMAPPTLPNPPSLSPLLQTEQQFPAPSLYPRAQPTQDPASRRWSSSEGTLSSEKTRPQRAPRTLLHGTQQRSPTTHMTSAPSHATMQATSRPQLPW